MLAGGRGSPGTTPTGSGRKAAAHSGQPTPVMGDKSSVLSPYTSNHLTLASSDECRRFLRRVTVETTSGRHAGSSCSRRGRGHLIG